MDQNANPLAAALQRLGTAIDQLDLAATRRQGLERTSAARTTELELMRGDRAKLAELLDQALLRGRKLEAATEEAAARIETTMTLVKAVLDSPALMEKG